MLKLTIKKKFFFSGKISVTGIGGAANGFPLPLGVRTGTGKGEEGEQQGAGAGRCGRGRRNPAQEPALVAPRISLKADG